MAFGFFCFIKYNTIPGHRESRKLWNAPSYPSLFVFVRSQNAWNSHRPNFRKNVFPEQTDHENWHYWCRLPFVVLKMDTIWYLTYHVQYLMCLQKNWQVNSLVYCMEPNKNAYVLFTTFCIKLSAVISYRTRSLFSGICRFHYSTWQCANESASNHRTAFSGPFWTGLLMLNGFHFLVISLFLLFFFYFWVMW